MAFTNTVSKILHDYHLKSKKEDTMGDKMRVMEAAAKLIKIDIRSIVQSKDNYPTSEEISVEKSKDFTPEFLSLFLNILFPGVKSSKSFA